MCIHYFSYSCLKHRDCGYSLEPTFKGGSNEYPQSMFWAEIRKISDFLSEKLSDFGGEIFIIFEWACFLNAWFSCWRFSLALLHLCFRHNVDNLIYVFCDDPHISFETPMQTEYHFCCWNCTRLMGEGWAMENHVLQYLFVFSFRFIRMQFYDAGLLFFLYPMPWKDYIPVLWLSTFTNVPIFLFTNLRIVIFVLICFL